MSALAWPCCRHRRIPVKNDRNIMKQTAAKWFILTRGWQRRRDCSANTASQLCPLVSSSSVLINLALGDDVAAGLAGHSPATLAATQPWAAAPSAAPFLLCLPTYLRTFLCISLAQTLFDSGCIAFIVTREQKDLCLFVFCYLLLNN